MCVDTLLNDDHIQELKLYVAMAWDTMAMGNFPFPSTYLTSGEYLLPAYPVRKSCEHLANVSDSDSFKLLQQMKEAINVFYNATGKLTCHILPEDKTYDGIWDYMWCTETMC